MSAERRRPTPKEITKKGKKESARLKEISFPQLRKYIKNFDKWGFKMPGGEDIIRWGRGHRATIVYIGQIPHTVDSALNLIVLEQIREDKNRVQSVHWYYDSFMGYPVKKAISEVQDWDREVLIHRAAAKCEPIGIARLEEKMGRDVREFRRF